MLGPDLQLIATIVRARAGIVLGDDKAYLIESRLAVVARRFGFSGLDGLTEALRRAPPEPLLEAITEAMTTNETSFFRDGKPFEQLTGLVLPHLIAARAAARSLRFWSAAASTGQEAYSIAMCLDEWRPPLAGWRLSILGTDLSQAAVERAREGRFSAFEVQRGLSPARLAQHCRRSGDDWLIEDRLKALVTFTRRNLLESCRQLGQFDVVFLRNVLIYFDLETRRRVLDEVATMLPDDGFLLLGGTETVLGVTDAFRAVPEARGLFQPSRVPTAAVALTRRSPAAGSTSMGMLPAVAPASAY